MLPPLKDILKDIKDKKNISMSYIQRNYEVGFNKAGETFKSLVGQGFVSNDGKVNKENVYKALNEKLEPPLNLIFLDIDGVLNCKTTKDVFCGHRGIEDEKISLLKHLVDLTNAKIILTSTWNIFWYKEPHLKDKQDEMATYLDEKLSKQGLVISDKTDNFNFIDRGISIIEYIRHLKYLGLNVDNFVIFDDEMFDYKESKLTKYLVRISFQTGLQLKHIKKALAILKGE